MDKIVNLFNLENFRNLLPFLDNTVYLFFFFGVVFLFVFLLISIFVKKKTKSNINETTKKQPNLNEIVDSRNIKISDDNEFVDVLVAIEEEMTAIRELYVGGYISKGVYISETDRLYEKAKIFGV